MRFTKMHGLGNDYVFVNCFEEKVKNPAELAKKVSDRHRGIGADGLILICPSTLSTMLKTGTLRTGPSKKADVRMRIFNADGSEAEMCGNGIRCVAKYVYEHKLAKPGGAFSVPGQPPYPVPKRSAWYGAYPASLRIETGSGILTVGLAIDKNDKVQKICVNMGQPILAPKNIPVKLDGDKVVEQPVEILGRQLQMTCVSMGNPHAVFFCDDVGSINLKELGPAIENHELFPNRVNVHFVQIDNSVEFTMRTWERGSGITMACGSGACACCVAAVLAGQTERACTAHLPGGDLDLSWCEKDNCVYMAGPAVEVFEGVWPEK